MHVVQHTQRAMPNKHTEEKARGGTWMFNSMKFTTLQTAAKIDKLMTKTTKKF